MNNIEWNKNISLSTNAPFLYKNDFISISRGKMTYSTVADLRFFKGGYCIKKLIRRVKARFISGRI